MILGLDTAGQSGSVALVDGTQVLASFSLRHVPAFSAHLLRLVDFLCQQVDCRITAIDGLAVNLGPGGFTSLRVGLATAQGLAMAWGKPLVGCSAFEALAGLVEGWEGPICPVLEAHRGEVYAALYRRDEQHLRETTAGFVLSPEALCDLLPGQTLLLGNGVRAYRSQFAALLGHRAVYLDSAHECGLAASVARRGALMLQTPPPEGWPLLQPLYIRAADARLPRHPAVTPQQGVIASS
ncbi:MAG: tRNA (adenosine(37)-N6)-threonylcarbamoyltransferase complex dimerization subunit type 1 TsaB [Candidatus Tectimicrobiota bacterium]